MTNLEQYTDRQLLEAIYTLLIGLYAKLNEVGDDSKQLFINMIANAAFDNTFNNRFK